MVVTSQSNILYNVKQVNELLSTENGHYEQRVVNRDSLNFLLNMKNDGELRMPVYFICFSCNKKLSYRRDNARRWSLHCSRSLKSLILKCDFLLMNHTLTDVLSRTVFQLLPSIDQIIAFEALTGGVPLFSAFVLRILYECRHKSLAKLDSLHYKFQLQTL